MSDVRRCTIFRNTTKTPVRLPHGPGLGWGGGCYRTSRRTRNVPPGTIWQRYTFPHMSRTLLLPMRDVRCCEARCAHTPRKNTVQYKTVLYEQHYTVSAVQCSSNLQAICDSLDNPAVYPSQHSIVSTSLSSEVRVLCMQETVVQYSTIYTHLHILSVTFALKCTT